MNLQTKISLPKASENSISYTSKILFLGSCFSENIGSQFSYYKFKSVQNPFGILFHPKAIENLISAAINNKIYTDKDLIYQNVKE